jgi:DNA polymerase III epsilon subunit-like protein
MPLSRFRQTSVQSRHAWYVAQVDRTPVLSDTGSARPGYARLRDQAVRILAETPGGLDDAALAAALFGTATGQRWSVLLGTVLGGDTRLRQADGHWHLASSAVRVPPPMPPDPSTPSFPPSRLHDSVVSAGLIVEPPVDPASLYEQQAALTLALATTGADPARHRIARVAVVRREDSEITARLDLLVNSGRRLSRSLRTAARIAEDDLDEAPTFEQIVPALRELVEGRTVAVYGAGRARAFLEAELRRADLPGLDLRLVELDDLVRAVLPGVRKPGLTAAASDLGIPEPSRGTPLAEAELASRVLERLAERQAASPARAAMPDRLDPVRQPRSLPFTREWLTAVPEGPGVYLVEDAAGRTLYIGKAVALRRRLATYVGTQLSLHRRLEALGVRAAAVKTVETPSDLEATLLEARLICDRQPPFNVARQTRGPATIVRAGPDDPRPRVHLVEAVRLDGARYFGPFESSNVARHLLTVARAAYPGAFERRRGDLSEQRRAVLAVCMLLAGQKEPTVQALRLAMRGSAARGDAMTTTRLRAVLRDVQALTVRPSLLAGFGTGWRLLVLERLLDGETRTHLIQDGRLLRSVSWGMSALPSDSSQLVALADEMLAAEPDDDTESGAPSLSRVVTPATSHTGLIDPDEPAVVLRWLAQARNRIEVARLPGLSAGRDN